MGKQKNILAKRLRKACHISPLRFKLRRLAAEHPTSLSQTNFPLWRYDMARNYFKPKNDMDCGY